jgi:hypothetical protein
MSIRMPSELTAICGASDGQEIPVGLIGGKIGRAVPEPEAAGTIDL